jgi:hypothetical protein
MRYPWSLMGGYRVLAVVTGMALCHQAWHRSGEVVGPVHVWQAPEHLTPVMTRSVSTVFDYTAPSVLAAWGQILSSTTEWSSFCHTPTVPKGCDIITTQSHGGATSHSAHEGGVVDLIEAGRDVSLKHPLIVASR